MRILGVDPGSVTTGFGVIDHVRGNNVLVEQGCIRTTRGTGLPSRLQQIYTGIVAVIERSAPEVVAVETPFAGVNVKSLIHLAHARGVILLAAQSAGLEVVEYSPRSVKSAVVGYGNAEKSQVAKMVRLLITGARECEIASDAADALAVAVCHAHSAKLRTRG